MNKRDNWIYLFVLLALGINHGCTGTRAAYKAADGVDETAKVVAEHYYALVREANALKDAGTLSGSALIKAQDLVRDTRPVILELANAAQAFDAVQSAETEAELERAIQSAAIAVSKLVDVIKGAQPVAVTGGTSIGALAWTH